MEDFWSIAYEVPTLLTHHKVETEIEEFTSVSAFSGRLVELLADPMVEVRAFQMGTRKAKIMWSGTVELP